MTGTPGATGGPDPGVGSSEAADPRWVPVVGVLLCVACALLAGLIEVLLVPLYVGSVIVPATLLLTAATAVGLPLLARRLSRNPAAPFAPYVAWLVTVFVLGLVPRPEGDVLLVGTGAQSVVGLTLIGLGSIVGVITAGVVGLRGDATGPAAGRPAPARTGTGSRGGASSRGR